MAKVSGIDTMKKIIAEVKLLTNKSFCPRIFCIDQDESEDEAISLTLCDSLWELCGEPLLKLEGLIADAVSGKYVSKDSNIPDMAINEKLIWVRPPFAAPGGICISNENVPEFSIDEGSPQRFTSNQFNVVATLVSDFSIEIAKQGRESLVNHRFEVDFPEG